jgi:hypothetical protein
MEIKKDYFFVKCYNSVFSLKVDKIYIAKEDYVGRYNIYDYNSQDF